VSRGRPDLDELLAAARRWRDADPDPLTRTQMDEVIDRADLDELDQLVGTELEFGTAGLRAARGPGPNRMNRLVVRRAAVALAGHLSAQCDHVPRVLVGHDARHGSAQFADDLVEVLSGEGLRVERFDEPVPTPLAAFSARDRHVDAAVVVTASHNPVTDNGLKLYGADGAQIVPPTDREIAELLRAVPPERAAGHAHAPVTTLSGPSHGGEVVERYLDAATTLVRGRRWAPLRVAHTSLHGVGDRLLSLALARMEGIEAVAVRSQQRPDPDFPGLPVPNPEEPGVLDELLALAVEVDADVALALDPDADRLAVALPAPAGGGWRVLTGDEVGALLTADLLTADLLAHSDPSTERLVTTTIVSSRLVPAMCAAAGVHHVETLTGFKWLCRPGLQHPHWRQLLMYEEALGYAVGPDARDKDGITAAVSVLAALGGWRLEGRSAGDVLDELAHRHGAHVTRNGSVRGRATLDVAPAALGGVEVASLDRPAPDVTRLVLADRTRVIMRPSGTEPKLKYYLEAIEAVTAPDADGVAAARAAAEVRLDAIATDLLALLAG